MQSAKFVATAGRRSNAFFVSHMELLQEWGEIDGRLEAEDDNCLLREHSLECVVPKR